MNASALARLLAPWLGAGPTYQAVAAGLRALTLDGRLAVDARMPSERELAPALRVSRGTVSAAYDVLRSEGYLRSNRGGGSRVSLPAAGPTRPEAEPAESGDVLDLTVAALPAPAPLLEAVEGAARRLHPLLAGPGLHPLGLPELREAIAGHLSRNGLATEPAQVLVTSGALHGWDLVLRSQARPGQRVLVEQPAYPGVLDALAAHRVRPVPLPVGAHGWGAPAGPANLAHVSPDGQNPTGLLADVAQRQQLLGTLGSARVVTDETFADLVLDATGDGSPPPRLAALRDDVITLGSMSKAFWAGLRVGWVRADTDLVRGLAQLRAGQDLATPVLEQLVAVELLARAEALLDQRRGQLRRSRAALAQALRTRLPDWRFTMPGAGMVLWVELPEPGATRLAAHARDLGLRLTPGPRFTVHGTADRFLRLPFTLPAEKMAFVVDMLAQAADLAQSGAPARHRVARWTA